MIFTGFTDPKGNVIPVQGAGTIYNEEKNSLALGKDTVAIGQDQLVFGRGNVADANKVEIVGGGGADKASFETYFDYNSSLKKGDTTILWHGHPSNAEYYGVCLGHSSNDIIEFWNNKGYTNVQVNNFPDEEIAFISSSRNDRPANITLVTKSKKVYNGSHWQSGSYLNSLHKFTFAIEEESNVINWNTLEHIHSNYIYNGNLSDVLVGERSKIKYTSYNSDYTYYREVLRIGNTLEDAQSWLRTNKSLNNNGVLSITLPDNDEIRGVFVSTEYGLSSLAYYDSEIYILGTSSKLYAKYGGGDSSLSLIEINPVISLTYEANTDGQVAPTAKNIRTLGWDGTQWNAGDLTCDDGNGNTISLRALAAVVSALTANS